MPDPMWRQIAEDLRQKIESGELGSGDVALPTELELRETYNASRNTVRDAVKWLATRGLVVTRAGKGTFVARQPDPFVTRLSSEIGAGPNAETATYASEVGAPEQETLGLDSTGRDPASNRSGGLGTEGSRRNQPPEPPPAAFH